MFILGISLLANIAFALFAIGLLAVRGVGRLAEPGRHFRIFVGGLAFQVSVFLLLFTYEYWAYALFD